MGAVRLPADRTEAVALASLVALFPGAARHEALTETLKAYGPEGQASITSRPKGPQFEADVKSFLNSVVDDGVKNPEEELTADAKLLLLPASSDKAVAFVIVAADANRVVAAHSRFLPEFELDNAGSSKLATAVKDALESHGALLEKRPWAVVTSKPDLLRPHLPPDVAFERAETSSSAVQALCSRDDPRLAFVSQMGKCKKLLTMTLAVLNADLRRQSEKLLHERQQRREALMRGEAKKEPGDSGDMADKIAGFLSAVRSESGPNNDDLSGLLTSLRRYFEDSRRGSHSEAREKAGLAVGRLVERGVGADELRRLVSNPNLASLRRREQIREVAEFLDLKDVRPPRGVISLDTLAAEVINHFRHEHIPPSDRQRPQNRPPSPQQKDLELISSGDEEKPGVQVLGTNQKDDWLHDLLAHVSQETGAQWPVGKQKKVGQPRGRSFNRLKKFYANKIASAESSDGADDAAVSRSRDLIHCLFMACINMLKLKKAYNNAANKAEFIASIESLVGDSEAAILSRGGVTLSTLAEWTYQFFSRSSSIEEEEDIEQGSNFSGDHHRHALMELQRKCIGVADFAGLRRFYADALVSLGIGEGDAGKTADDCVELWVFAGFTAEDLSSVCAAAAAFESCLGVLVGKLTNTLGAISIFASASVDVRSMVRFAVVYFWQQQRWRKQPVKDLAEDNFDLILEDLGPTDAFDKVRARLISSGYDVFGVAREAYEADAGCTGVPKSVLRCAYLCSLEDKLEICSEAAEKAILRGVVESCVKAALRVGKEVCDSYSMRISY